MVITRDTHYFASFYHSRSVGEPHGKVVSETVNGMGGQSALGCYNENDD